MRACAREVREELGITPPIGRLLAIDWAPSPGEGDKVLYLFDGGQLEPEDVSRIALQPDELSAFEFLPQADVPSRTIPRLARRIEAAMNAPGSGGACLPGARPSAQLSNSIAGVGKNLLFGFKGGSLPLAARSEPARFAASVRAPDLSPHSSSRPKPLHRPRGIS